VSPARPLALLAAPALLAALAARPAGTDPDAAALEIAARLDAAAPADRLRLDNLARRYAAWLGTLPDPRRRVLDAAEPDRKLTLIQGWRAEARLRRDAGPPLQAALQLSALCPEPIRRTAADLRAWFALDPQRRARALAAPSEPEQLARLRASIRDDPDAAGARDAARAEFGLAPAEMRDAEPAPRRPARLRAPALKAEQNRRLADWRVLRDLGQPRVEPANLDRFEDALPPWTRRALDPLPADLARQRLALLYRLVFPAPAEMP
jgi:hypothetical protein